MWLFAHLPLDTWLLYYFQIGLGIFWAQVGTLLSLLCTFPVCSLTFPFFKFNLKFKHRRSLLSALLAQLYSLVLGLSIARLCKQEAGVLFTLPEAWLAEQGHPYNCTIMGIQDGREGSHKISRTENRGRRHPGKSHCTMSADRSQKDCWFVFLFLSLSK